MMRIVPRSIAALAALVVLVLAAGCARKAAEAPPTPAQTPPQPAEQPSTPAPQETPPTPSQTPGVSTGDFQPAFFAFDSYSLDDQARGALDHNAKLLRDNAGVQVTIEGHADERGTSEYNLALGERRAQAAREYLVAGGIDAGRLQTVSYGEERAFDPGHDEAAWAKNRRAHFVVR